MNVLNKKLRLSVNRKLFNKNEHGDTRAFGEGFENCELTPQELADSINQGFAYAAQYAGGKRSVANFIATDIVSVDIDGARTLNDALDDPFCVANLTILYCTPRHTEQTHRFRLIFSLPRTITDAFEYATLSHALALYFAGDEKCRDAARLFFGSSNSTPSVFDRQMNNEVLDSLLRRYRVKATPDSEAPDRLPAAVHSKEPIDATTVLTDKSGRNLLLREITQKTSVHCPFHFDSNPSAFVSRNDRGSSFLHCSTCKTTWWMQDEHSGTYEFNDFDKQLDEVHNESQKPSWDTQPRMMDPELTRRLRRIPSLANMRVQKSADQYFSLRTLHKGVVFVKSPKGSGKTSSLPDVMMPLVTRYASLQTLEESEDAEGAPHDLASNFTVLLVGHRRALIRDLARRLNLNCYLDDAEQDRNDQIKHLRRKRYAVCLDSLSKVRFRRFDYDMVIIDEVEQVLAHFLSSTLADQNRSVFYQLRDLLKAASYVVALDADLGWTGFDTITRMAGCTAATDKESKPVWVYWNAPQIVRGAIDLYRSKDHLIQDFLVDVRQGASLFVSSNSKSLVDTLENLIQKDQPSVKMMKITADTSNTREVQHFITNIRNEIGNYPVVLASPSLGTGVDISFEDQAVKIDRVYGLFENLVNTHFDIDQQLSRVRNPGGIRVWVSPRTFDFETDVEVISHELLVDNLYANTIVGHVSADAANEHEDAFLTTAALITSVARASKNQLRQNFVDLKKNQGFTVNVVDKDEEKARDGKTARLLGECARDELFVSQILSAPTLDPEAYLDLRDRLDDGGAVTQEERWSYLHTNLERFYCCKITADIIEDDQRGRLRSAVRVFESVTDSEFLDWCMFNMSNSEIPEVRLHLSKDRMAATVMLHQLLSSTNFFAFGEFDLDAIYTKDDLLEFVELAMANKKVIEGQFGVCVPRDAKKKPTQLLGSLLRLIGLSNKTAGTSKQGDQKTYSYRIEPTSFEQITEITARRRERHSGEDQEMRFLRMCK